MIRVRVNVRVRIKVRVRVEFMVVFHFLKSTSNDVTDV
jgi:hypothetical protein